MLVLAKKAQAEDFLSDLIPAIIVIIIGFILMSKIGPYNNTDNEIRAEMFNVIPTLNFFQMSLDNNQRVIDLFYNLDKNEKYLIQGNSVYHYYCNPTLFSKFETLLFSKYSLWHMTVKKGNDKLFECGAANNYQENGKMGRVLLKENAAGDVLTAETNNFRFIRQTVDTPSEKFIFPIKGSKDKLIVEVDYNK
ncbi:hypothetical protein D6777_01430 [Candidatus Woesearchaeota archaeon]|nr:MAG: hypothetical protein D6777_01430 [Candidatus Woesearchaeota archaeon]